MKPVVRIFVPFLKIALSTVLLATGFAAYSQPSNDLCDGALESLTNEDGSCNQVNFGTTVGATQSSVLSCYAGTLNSVDVWYSFVPTGTDATISFASINPLAFFGITYYGFELYSGTDCASLTSIGCDFSNTGVFYDPSIIATGLTPGVTYYVKVISNRDLEFNLCIQVTGIPTPVVMDALKGNITKQGLVKLEWNTYREERNHGFGIQRSVDGRSFENIGFVAARAATTTGNISYSFIDEKRLSGVVYYRLQQTDADGKKTFSNIVHMSEEQGSFTLSASPNPAHDKITVSVPGKQVPDGTVTIRDLSGRIVQQQHAVASAATLDIGHLPAGMYLLQYSDGSQASAMKMIKE